MNKTYRINHKNIKDVDDVKAIFMVLNPVLTMPPGAAQKQLDESDLFAECCASCGRDEGTGVEFSSEKSAPESICKDCFERLKSDAIKKRIVQK